LKKSTILLSLFNLLFFGCAAHQVEPEINFKAPRYVQELPPKIEKKNFSNDGSVFGRGDNPLFSDRKAMRVNDIVTVIIDEKTFQSSQGNKKIIDNSQNELGGGVLSGGSGIAQTFANKVNPLTNLSFKTGSKSSFNASGINSRNEKFTTTITARVIKILNNGNYFIEGSRELLLNGTKQIAKISGVIRPYDIDQSNTINSKYIADAKILYETQGDIQQATTKPWGSKLVENIWPF